MHFVNLSCMQVLNSANSILYNKILKLSSSARKYLEVGSIMNMILTAIVMLVWEVGWIGLVAPFLFFIGMGIQQKLMKKGF